MKNILYIVIACTLMAGSYWLGRKMVKVPTIIDHQIDTVIMRDTIREIMPVPQYVEVIRTQVETVKVVGDTVYVEVEIPIESKVYETADYRAEISGFKPSLDKMDIYRQSSVITEIQTVKVHDKRPWGLGIQVGFGGAVTGGKIKAVPYVGIGVSYNILTW